MPELPAICENGHISRSGFVATESYGITLMGVFRRCPVCNAKAQVPDGLYNFLGDVVQFVAGPASSLAQIRRIQAILERAQAEKHDREQIAEALRAEAPELAGLADLLPRTRTELYAFLSLLVAILIGIGNCYEKEPDAVIKLDDVIEQMMPDPQPRDNGPKTPPAGKGPDASGRGGVPA